MPTYEMFWDCPACGTEKLLGKTHRHCPACGHPQDPSYRYFPPEDEKVAVEDHVFVGVDWTCDRCETPNSAAATHCVNCGDARDKDDGVVERLDEVRAGAQSGTLEDEAPEPVDEPLPPRRGGFGKVLVLLLGCLFVCGTLTALFYTAEATAEVTGHHWQRDVRIDRMASVSDGSWCDSVPGDAYSVSRSQKKRSTNRIPDGQSCSTYNVDNGDGTFSTQERCTTTYREEPVYDDWCDYQVDRWRHDHTETANGRGLSAEPYWPSYSVSGGSGRGSTRVGGRSERYFVELVDADGTKKDCDYDQSRWSAMEVGSRWTGEKRVLLNSLVCDGLVREGR